MSTPSSRWALARDISAVILVVIGVPAVVLISVLIGNWWLLGAEALVVLGLALGLRRTPPPQTEQPRDVHVTVIEHEK